MRDTMKKLECWASAVRGGEWAHRLINEEEFRNINEYLTATRFNAKTGSSFCSVYSVNEGVSCSLDTLRNRAHDAADGPARVGLFFPFVNVCCGASPDDVVEKLDDAIRDEEGVDLVGVRLNSDTGMIRALMIKFGAGEQDTHTLDHRFTPARVSHKGRQSEKDVEDIVTAS